VPRKRTSSSKVSEPKPENGDSTDEEEFKILVGPEYLTRFERSRIIGAVALQISMGAPILIELDEDMEYNPIEIAKLELEQGVLPLTIRRTTPSGFYQDIPLHILLKNPLSFR